MPNVEYERLKVLGSFGLDVGIRVEILTRQMGGGRRRDLLYGSRAGIRNWRLVFNTLIDTFDRPVQTTAAQIESEANYLWHLFMRCKTGHADINRPIIITCPRDQKDYLAVFTAHELKYNLFMTRLYATGVELEYTTVPGVNTLSDGSLGEADNNAEI